VVIDPIAGRWARVPVELDRWRADDAAGALVGVDTDGAPRWYGPADLAALVD
jgi:hypothetical protein